MRNGKTLEQLAWRLLKKHPEGVAPAAIGAALKISNTHVRDVLKKVRDKGYARFEGRGNVSLNFAIGNEEPDNMLGTNPKSLDNLRQNWKGWGARKRRMKLVVPAPAIALQACWCRVSNSVIDEQEVVVA